jgi:hypothetical protein
VQRLKAVQSDEAGEVLGGVVKMPPHNLLSQRGTSTYLNMSQKSMHCAPQLPCGAPLMICPKHITTSLSEFEMLGITSITSG